MGRDECFLQKIQYPHFVPWNTFFIMYLHRYKSYPISTHRYAIKAIEKVEVPRLKAKLDNVIHTYIVLTGPKLWNPVLRAILCAKSGSLGSW